MSDTKRNVAGAGASAEIRPKTGGRSVEDLLKPSQASSPSAVLSLYPKQLTEFEKTEILLFPEVYYFGSGAIKAKGWGRAENNMGLDNEEGFLYCVPRDHINYRYQMLEILGKGTFGEVFKCFDHKEGTHVAIKIFANKPVATRQMERELKILRFILSIDKDDKGGAVRLLNSFTFRSHSCMVLELLSNSLWDVLKNTNNKPGLSYPMIKEFGLSLVKALKFLSTHKLVHHDIKPENVVLRKKGGCELKIIDFGTAWIERPNKFRIGGGTRLFKAPEIIMEGEIGTPIDMWALGCLLAELALGVPLFAGEDDGDQIALMVEMLGSPPENLFQSWSKASHHFTADGLLISILSKGGKLRGAPGSRKLEQVFKGVGEPTFVDFVKRCLRWDSKVRMTPSEALDHEWLNQAETSDFGEGDRCKP